MRHRRRGKKLSRNTKQRQALFKGLIRSLILREEIKISEAKAKVIKPLADKLISKAKAGSLSARRQILAFLPDKQAVHKLFEVIVPRLKDRTSGFTRFIRLGHRRGDNTMMVKMEFVDKPASPAGGPASPAGGPKKKEPKKKEPVKKSK
jgi:large subunit ribosomal protein L17